MAGEIFSQKWVLELELNDAAFTSALARIKSQVGLLSVGAATPGSGPVAGAGTASNPSLAARTGETQAAANLLNQRIKEAEAQGIRISQALATQVSALANGGVIGEVSGALGTRTTGGVNQEKFVAAAEAQTRAQTEAAAQVQAGTAANRAAQARIAAAQAELAAATAAAANEQKQIKPNGLAGDTPPEQGPNGIAARRAALTGTTTLVDTSGEAAVRLSNLTSLQQEEVADKVAARIAEARAKIAEQNLLQQDDIAKLLAEEKAAINKTNVKLREETAIVEKAAYEQSRITGAPENQPGLVQRLQAFIANRSGGDFKDPNQFQDAGQLLSSRLLTTASFAVSAASTYGAITAITSMAKESAALERALSLVKAQFDTLGDSQGFDKFRQGILGVSQDVGVQASQVAALASVFKGAFGGSSGGLSDAAVIGQVKDAVEFAKVAGVDLKDIGNSLVAVVKTYGTNVTEVTDATVALQQVTGVSAKEIVDGLGVVAPVADQAGLSLQQMSGLIATAAQLSGRSATQIAENFARILPEVQKNTVPLVQFFSAISPGAGQQAEQALIGGEPGKIIDLIGQNYDKLNASQQQYVLSLIGSRRDTQSLIAAFQDYPEVLKNIDAAQNSQGVTAQAYGRLQETLSQQISRLSAAFKAAGETILRLGLTQVLQDIAKALGTISEVAAGVLSFLGDFNDLTGGVAGRVIGLTAELYALYKILSLIREFTLSKFAIDAAIGTGEGAATGGLLAGILAKIRGGAAAGGGVSTGEVAAEAAGGTVVTGGIISRVVQAIKGGTTAAEVGPAATSGLILPAGVELPAAAAPAAISGIDFLRALPSAIGARAGGLGAGLELTAGSVGTALAAYGGIGLVEPIANLGYSPGNIFDQKERDKLGQLQQTASTASTADLRAAFAQQFGGLSGPVADYKDVGSAPWFNTLFETGKRDISSTLGDLTSITDIKNEIANPSSDNSTRESDVALLQYRTKQVDDKKALIKELVAEGKITQTLADTVLNSDKITDFTKFLDKNNISSSTQAIAQKNVEDQTAIGVAVANQQSAAALFDAGVTGPQDYQQQLKDSRDKAHQVLLDALAAPGGGNPVTIKQALADYKQANDDYNKLVKQLGDANTAFSQLGLTLSGANQGQILQSNLSTIAASIGATNDPAQRLKDVQSYVQAQQQLTLYLASQAKTIDEAYKIASTPVKLPPSIQTALQEIRLSSSNDATAVLTAVAVAQGTTLDKLVAEGGKVIAAGGDYRAYLKKQLEAWVNKLIQQAEDLQKANQDDKELDALINRILAALGSLTGPQGAALGKQRAATSTVDQNAVKATQADAIAAANNAVDQALANGDPVKLAQAAQLAAAEHMKAALKLTAGSPEQQAAVTKAYAETIAANNQAANAQNDVAKSRLAISAAYAAQDPVAAAQVAIQQADLAYSTAHSEAERNAAIAQKISAQHQLQDAYTAIQQANLNVLAAAVADDPVKAAQVAIQQAQVAYANAHDEASRMNALAQEITAQHQLRDALGAAKDAQANLMIAMATARGDVITAASLTLTEAQQQYARLIQSGVSPTSTKALDAFRNVVTQQAALRDTTLHKQEDDIQFELDMKRITAGQAITRLSALKSSAVLTDAESKQIDRQIQALKNQLSKDLQFNIPNIILPDLYQVRKEVQQGAGSLTGLGGATPITGAPAYNDNRVINVTVNGTNMTPAQVQNAIGAAVARPSVFGNGTKLYP